MNKFRKPHGNGDRDGGRFNKRGQGHPGFERPARPQFGGPRRDGPELFDAVCSKCGKDCQVPFRPSGQKPVYCRACFGGPAAQVPSNRENFRDRGAANSFEPRIGNKSIADLERQIWAMNNKIDSMLKILESMSVAASPVRMMPSSVSMAPNSQETLKSDPIKKKVTKKKSVTVR